MFLNGGELMEFLECTKEEFEIYKEKFLSL